MKIQSELKLCHATEVISALAKIFFIIATLHLTWQVLLFSSKLIMNQNYKGKPSLWNMVLFCKLVGHAFVDIAFKMKKYLQPVSFNIFSSVYLFICFLNISNKEHFDQNKAWYSETLLQARPPKASPTFPLVGSHSHMCIIQTTLFVMRTHSSNWADWLWICPQLKSLSNVCTTIYNTSQSLC